MREIALHPTAEEPPVVVYDTSGPYTDPALSPDIAKGLSRLREPWILRRGDVETYEGRAVAPADNGFVSPERETPTFPALRQPMRTVEGRAVTQFAYAPAGIVTPEMEFVAIHEN